MYYSIKFLYKPVESIRTFPCFEKRLFKLHLLLKVSTTKKVLFLSLGQFFNIEEQCS